jgi:hypothetical protein
VRPSWLKRTLFCKSDRSVRYSLAGWACLPCEIASVQLRPSENFLAPFSTMRKKVFHDSWSSSVTGMMVRSEPWLVGKGCPRPTNMVMCRDFCCSFEEMYLRAGKREGVKVSTSKSESGDNGGDIISVVMLRDKVAGTLMP